MFKRLTSVLVLSAVAGCANRPAGPYAPPDTPAGRLRSISYMPYVGGVLDIGQQQERAQEWASWWNDIYPGTRWVLSQEAASLLMKASLTEAWLAAEPAYWQLGGLPNPLVSRICASQATEGILQMGLSGVQAGSVSSSWFTPGFLQRGGGTPSAARMTAVLYSCSTEQVVWRHSYDLTYQASYTRDQMVDYVHRTLAKYMPR